jgi:tol-pal system protein YbgF
MVRQISAVILAVLLAGAASAQEPTVGDIHADLQILSQQLEELRAGLSTTGSTTLSARDAASALVRIDEISADLRRALGRVEALEIKTQNVIDDGTRRIGDIEFRLSELEGTDPGQTPPPPPPPLGGAAPRSDVISPERKAFNAAKKALADGDAAGAAAQFTAFLANFPDGPLTSEAQYLLGNALAATGDDQNAARAYLSGFSGAPDGDFAPRSLYGLSVSLFKLGQGEQACLTLAEINVRYSDIDQALAQDIEAQRGAMSCP